jgi:hypothetical protein
MPPSEGGGNAKGLEEQRNNNVIKTVVYQLSIKRIFASGILYL